MTETTCHRCSKATAKVAWSGETVHLATGRMACETPWWVKAAWQLDATAYPEWH